MEVKVYKSGKAEKRKRRSGRIMKLKALKFRDKRKIRSEKQKEVLINAGKKRWMKNER